MTTQTLIYAVVAVVVGALTARFLKAQPWQGAVVIIAGLLLAMIAAIFFASYDTLPLLIAQMLGSGIAGGVMKLRGNQIAGIFVAATLGQLVVFLVDQAV